MNKTIALMAKALVLTAALAACTKRMGDMEVRIENEWQTVADSLLRQTMEAKGYPFGQLVVARVAPGERQINVLVSAGRPKDSVSDPWEYACHSGLVRPFVMGEALESGAIKLSDTVRIDSGMLRVEGREYYDHNWRRGGFGAITYAKGFNQQSNIAAYHVASKVRKGSAHDIYCQANGYDKKHTAIEWVARYADFALAPGADSLKAIMNPANWTRLQRARWRTKNTALTFYHSGTYQKIEKSSFRGMPFCAQLCGYFEHEGNTYVVYAMMEKNGVPCTSLHLADFVPRLVDHICKPAPKEKKK